MKLTSILSLIVTIIRYIPDLYKIFSEVIALFQSYSEKKEAQEKAQKVAEAIKKAKETKDTGDLEGMFGNSFDIKFVTQKKSLDLGALSVQVDLKDRQRIVQEIQKLQEETEEIPELKKIENFVTENLDQIIEETPEPEKKKFSLFGFGRSGDVSFGASLINTVYMSGAPRMTSRFFIILMCSSLLLSCKTTGGKNAPKYTPALYAGDASNGGISRKQSGSFIRATDPQFDDFVAMRYSTLACIHKTYIANCREYIDPTPNCDGKDVSFIKDLIKSR